MMRGVFERADTTCLRDADDAERRADRCPQPLTQKMTRPMPTPITSSRPLFFYRCRTLCYRAPYAITLRHARRCDEEMQLTLSAYDARVPTAQSNRSDADEPAAVTRAQDADVHYASADDTIMPRSAVCVVVADAARQEFLFYCAPRYYKDAAMPPCARHFATRRLYVDIMSRRLQRHAAAPLRLLRDAMTSHFSRRRRRLRATPRAMSRKHATRRNHIYHAARKHYKHNTRRTIDAATCRACAYATRQRDAYARQYSVDKTMPTYISRQFYDDMRTTPRSMPATCDGTPMFRAVRYAQRDVRACDEMPFIHLC